MIPSRSTSATLVGLSTTLLLQPFAPVDGHGYIKSPRSRNFVAHEDTIWWPVSASNPAPESEPQSANIGGVEARCGIIGGSRNYDLPRNQLGGMMAPNPQACWQPGQVVEFDVLLTAHHKGHFEFHACPIQPGEVPTQACFDSHPLSFVSGEGAPPDPNYPVRAYLPPSKYNLKYQYRLPPALSGDLVLIQWYYVTANSCMDAGYDSYDFPVGWYPGTSTCPSIPPDGRGLPEQFWNCAEVRIVEDCGGDDGPPVTTTTTTSTTTTEDSVTTTTSATTTIIIDDPSTTLATTTTTNPPNPACSAQTASCGPSITCASVGYPGMCCSEWGYCGATRGYCGGGCCQNGPCENINDDPAPPTPAPPSVAPPTPTPPTTGFHYGANHGEDSRLIAYVGNWQTCPTPEQVDAYSHIVVAFAVSYTYSPSKNNCDTQCNIATSVPVCGNQNRQDLVNGWRTAGKKVILSFGGAGMGGSWSGDANNCWDFCFQKEETLSTALVDIIDKQNFDGIDIDYEYCYDIGNKQSGKCPQRTAAYSDLKAQTFLDRLTFKLRMKLDALQDTNGYDRGRYEVTHAPMDSDLTPSTSAYFRILHDRREDLDFLMPQFYNGVTRPAGGIDGSGGGQMSAATLFERLSNELFDSEPNKVVFGHCLSACSGTGSNINAAQAVQVTSHLKQIKNGEFACNGGAFFWVALHDTGGAWSDAVVAEISETAGCSTWSTTTGATTTSTTTTEDPATTTAAATTAITTEEPATTSATTTTTTTTTKSTAPPTTASPTTATPTNFPTKKPTAPPTTVSPTSRERSKTGKRGKAKTAKTTKTRGYTSPNPYRP